ncbi:MAG: DUF3987 domain-containing protein [bacterium]|nr:DUF3987 domain-containing protein [bacterium]
MGIPATCNPHGAGKWADSYSELLKERDVIIWPDKDEAGKRHAQQVARSLFGKAKSIRVVEPPAELPEKGDIIDALKLPGWTKERVQELLAEAKPYAKTQTVTTPPPPRRPEFKLELPDTVWRGVVATYRDMLERTTEAAEAYHLFTFLTCAGSMLGRRAFIEYGLRLYGNLYVAIVGKTGESRKTTSLRHAERTLRLVDETWRILRGISSAEGLLSQIADPWEKLNGKGDVIASGGTEDKRILVWLGELSSLLRKAKQDRVANIIPILTEAFDNPPDLHLPTKADPITVTEPFVSILAASTPSWLEDLQDRDVLGGFGNRFAYILGGPKEPIPFPDPPSRLHQTRIVSHLAEVDAWLPNELEVTLTGEARELWAEFYTRWNKLTWPDELFSAIVQRIPDVALKIALLYAVLEKRTEVDAEILSAAIDAGGYAVASAQRIFTTFHQTRETKLESRILDILKDSAVKFGPLHRSVGGRYSTAELNRTLDALTRSGQIWKQEQGNTVAFGISDED